MTAELTKPYEEKMKKTIAVLESDYATIRAGRANPHVLDKIMVDYYGTPTPVNQVGNVTVPEARLIQIQPWDTSTLKAIEKAINMSDLGINPNNDGKVIRLVFPELTEERRKELNKDVKKKAETAKIHILQASAISKGRHPQHPPRWYGCFQKDGKEKRNYRR